MQSHSDNHDLWINPKNNKAMIEGNDGGATVTTTGTTWTGAGQSADRGDLPARRRHAVAVLGVRRPAGQLDDRRPEPGHRHAVRVGGGESGFIAVDPRDYNIVYAGNYGGTISRLDRKINLSESIRVYADMQTGQRAADMKYRFQWNTPILISPHTPDVVYTTSQHVHRSTNEGQDWQTISPDLTRNEKRQQDYSGGEGITRDSTGVEVYGTIFALQESLIAPGLLWAGSDDGLVHISRDNGKTWVNVTPKGLAGGLHQFDRSVRARSWSARSSRCIDTGRAT